MKPPILIRGHMGLGDHLITNALVREFAKEHEAVFIPCKAHNFTSVRFMWGDLPNVSVVPVENDVKAEELCHCFKGEVLRIGMFGEGFSFEQWDKCMYDQAGVQFFKRWSEFEVRRSSNMVKVPLRPYDFIHEDPSRAYRIQTEPELKRGAFRVHQTETIFDWMDVIANAEEIHCIDSSFAILADSMKDLKAKRLVIHLYARQNAKPPTYDPKKRWEILR